MSFKSKVEQKIKGEEAGVKAGRVEQLAKAAFSGQVASLTSAKVQAEIKLSDAKNRLEDAKYPVSISDTAVYISGIRNAQAEVDARQEEVDSINESIEFYESTSKELFGN